MKVIENIKHKVTSKSHNICSKRMCSYHLITLCRREVSHQCTFMLGFFYLSCSGSIPSQTQNQTFTWLDMSCLYGMNYELHTYCAPLLFVLVGRKRVRYSSVQGWGRVYRMCSCNLLKTSQCKHTHTCGSKCHNSGQSKISRRNTLLCIRLQFLSRGCKACKSVAPWVCLLKTHIDTKRRDIGGNHSPEKNCLLYKSRTRTEKVYKTLSVEEKIIGCQGLSWTWQNNVFALLS